MKEVLKRIAITISGTILLVHSFHLSAQAPIQPPNGMTAESGNFNSFATNSPSATIEEWAKYNSPSFLNHPEYGVHAYGAPDEELVEELSKRTADERYFINPEHPSEFFYQKSYSPMHFQRNGEWLSINPKLFPNEEGIYEASQQPEPVGFDIQRKHSYIQTFHGRIEFNNWSLFGLKDGQETLLATADWTTYSAGDDGLYIINVFPGIDLRMRVAEGAVKTDFILKENHFADVDYLLFRDRFHSESGNLSFRDEEGDALQVMDDSGNSILTISDAVAYPENSPEKDLITSAYKFNDSSIEIAISSAWIAEHISSGAIIIDPLVSSNNSLAQASINGSMYNASCYFDNSCDYYLNVTPPANATITNITTNFNYLAAGSCWLEDGALRYGLGSCISPNTAGYFWYCNTIGGGTCTGNNIPIWDDVSSCAPAPSCNPSPVQFILKFYRGCWGNVGCANGCISAGTAWSVTIQGRTLEYSSNNPNQQISLSATTVCVGASVTATANNIQNGVPPYTVNWSLNASGTPSVGSGNSVSVNFSNSGTNAIYCFVTDQCGNSINSSRNVTVTAPPAGPNAPSPIDLCLNGSSAALTSPGTSTQWYEAATGGNTITTPTPSTSVEGTTSYWVSQMVSGCESERSQVDVIIHPLPVISGTPVYTPSACNGSTGGISGISVAAPEPYSITWYDENSNAVSTANSYQDLINQAPGNYTLTVTDVYGCENTSALFTIPIENSPDTPGVTSPISYCQDETATQLQAIGNSLLWYTTPTGGTGNSSAPTPQTITPGTTSHYVSQTNNGCESLRSEIVVNVIETPVAPTVTTPVTYCKNDTSAPLEVTGSNLLWYSNPTGGSGSGNTPTVSTSLAGNFQFYVSQTVNGCESPRSTIALTVYELPAITGTPSITPSNCDANTGAISGLNVSNGSAPYQYSWHDVSGNEISTTLSISNLEVGSYSFHVSDQHQCQANYGPIVVPIANTPPPPGAQSPVEYCKGYTTVALSAVGNNLLWYNEANGGIGSNTAPTPSSDTPGTFSYYVTQTVNGCESNRKEIVVLISDSPGVEFSVSDQTGCSQHCITFQNLSTPSSSAIISYEWTANGHLFSDQVNPSYCFNQGTYNIGLLVTDAIGCKRQIIKDSYIISYPNPEAGFTASRYEVPEGDAQIEFTTSNPSSSQTVHWDFGDGSIDTGSEVSHKYTEPGRYCVKQLIQNQYGCSDRAEDCIRVISEFFLYIPNSFTPDGDDLNEVWQPMITGPFHSYRAFVFNRWGEIIFSTDNPEVPWVGDVNGSDHYALNGSYHFLIIVEDIDGIPKEYRGYVSLLR